MLRSNQTAKKRGSSSQDWNSQTDSDSDSDSQSDDSDDSRSTSSLHESDQSDTEETVTVETSTEGELVYRSQVDDYRFRGMELQNFNFLDFMVHTREEKISSGRPKAQDSTSSHRGPSLNMRSKYLDGHPRAKTHQRIARHSNHNKLPNIIGAWLPRNNDPELADFYSVSMLALLKPWRKLTEFETPGESWSSVFQSFLRSTTPRNLELIANAQYYYSCKDAAKQERDRWRNGEKTHGDFDPSCFTEDSEGELQETGISQARPITEQDLDAVRRLKETGAEACHGVVAVQKGRLVGLLPKDTSQSWVVDQAQLRFATSEDIHQIDSWKKTLSAEAQALRLNSTTTMQVDNDDHGDVSALDQISDTHGQGGSAVQPINAILPEVVPSVDVSRMNQDQLRAYTIIKRHLEANLAGQGRPQLLMQLLGEGGTGKSTVIHAIIDLFRALGVSERLVTAAPTGIAASLINGSTLHTLCRIRPGAAKTTSDDIPLKTLEFLHQSWRHVEYFIIDEISMVSRSFFAQISAAISAAKKDDTYPFGGIVVIICGDFHQFGPVARPEYEALYFPNNLPFRKPKSKEKVHDIMTGGEIFEKFTTVVILKEQCRMRDAEWNDLLRHARHGKCTPAHLALLNSLVVSPKGAGLSDVTNPVWQKATLITPRHGVRIAWNKQANRRHCRENHRQLFISVAYETVNKRELTLGEKYAAETRKASQRNEISEKGRLPDKVEIAIGMEVMVTTNIETELDLANGARGIVEDIIFDPKEDIDPASQEVELSHLPLCVLVKLFRTKAKTLPGLAENVVPITPMVQKYNLPNGKKGEKRVTRRQLPITSAYAFTDYRSQGQTMERVVVDLAPPPYGKLSPFNAYVAMSRSRGRDTIRLLREFDPTLFTTLPSEVLETAEKTFYELDKKTIVDL